MKRWFCLVLAGVLLLACTACGGEPASSEDGEADASTTTTTTKTTTTTQSSPSVAPYTDKVQNRLVVLKSNGTPEILSGNIGVPDATGVPHSDATVADLTDSEARAILEILIPRQFEVFFLFNLDHDKVDYTQSTPFSKWYSPYSDDRFSCVQDIRNFILQVYTEEEANRYFRSYLDEEGVPETSEHYPAYRDYNGKLYRCTYVEGKGLHYGYYLTHTSQIVDRTEDTVLVQMKSYTEDNEPETTYVFLLCKTPDGWRLGSEFLQDI